MKTIMMSIKPKHVKNILNGIKTLEIRKKFPKDYVGWVYIYNTKTTKDGYLTLTYIGNKLEFITAFNHHPKYQGKIVARFWCDKVDTFRCNITGNLKDGFFKAKPYCKVIEDGIANYNCDDEFEEILKNAQITNKELAQYLGDKEHPYGGWYVFNAIHITKLEIFDKPFKISEFMRPQPIWKTSNDHYYKSYQLTRAPQSWCYVEE